MVNLPGITLYQIRPWLIFGIVILLVAGAVPVAVAGLAAAVVVLRPATSMAAVTTAAEILPTFLTLSPVALPPLFQFMVQAHGGEPVQRGGIELHGADYPGPGLLPRVLVVDRRVVVELHIYRRIRASRSGTCQSRRSAASLV